MEFHHQGHASVMRHICSIITTMLSGICVCVCVKHVHMHVYHMLHMQETNTNTHKFRYLRVAGLDEAILGNRGGTDPEKDGKAITDLLKHGAHSILAQDEVKARDGENFAREDIDAILAGRTEKRQLGSRAGNTFSTATFAVQEQPAGQVSRTRAHVSLVC